MRNTCPDTAGPKYFVVLRLLPAVVRMLFHTPPLATCSSNAFRRTSDMSNKPRNETTRMRFPRKCKLRSPMVDAPTRCSPSQSTSLPRNLKPHQLSTWGQSQRPNAIRNSHLRCCSPCAVHLTMLRKHQRRRLYQALRRHRPTWLGNNCLSVAS